MSRGRTFTYDEALATFPVVRDRTALAVQHVEALFAGVNSREEAAARREELEAAFQRIIAAWAEEVSAVGCEVKGLWLIDWDCGDGYYCWRFPEATIAHFHGYEDGFAGRLPLT